jgi:hypothetical protein
MALLRRGDLKNQRNLLHPLKQFPIIGGEIDNLI